MHPTIEPHDLVYPSKKHRLRKHRNVIFLMVNLFVLLPNIGVLLMMTVPNAVRSEGMDDYQMIPYPRYDHQGKLSYPCRNFIN